MSKKINYAEIYIATDKSDPGALEIEGIPIVKIVEDVNKKSKSLKFRTITDTDLFLKNMKMFDWDTENNFRNRNIVLCIFDGQCYHNYTNEFFTIRAHFFPINKDLSRFCIISPVSIIDKKSDDEASEYIEKTLFRCKIIRPTVQNVKVPLQSIKLAWELGGLQVSKETSKKTAEKLFDFNLGDTQ